LGGYTLSEYTYKSISENTSWLIEMIKRFVNTSPENNLGGNYNERAWNEPLIGFSRGDDSYYQWFKQDIGEFLWTPQEIFLKTFPTIKLKSSDLTVISWILPQTELTKADMRLNRKYPAERATLSRVNGDIFNQKVGKYIFDLLNDNGYYSVAPVQSEFWESKESEKYGFASTWSEKHVAFISGLGTFSITDTLITNYGTAVRIGSVVSTIPVEPTKREYTKYNEYCLYYANGGCLKCAKRCPAGAITQFGHDKIKCREYQREVTLKHNKDSFNIKSNYCGLCQFDIPCESCNPKKT
jgi:Uncharacterized Fe-S protein